LLEPDNNIESIESNGEFIMKKVIPATVLPSVSMFAGEPSLQDELNTFKIQLARAHKKNTISPEKYAELTKQIEETQLLIDMMNKSS